MPLSTQFQSPRLYNVIAVLLSTLFLLLSGIICGPLWGSRAILGSFAVLFGDHLRSGIICGLGIICGAVQYLLVYGSVYHSVESQASNPRGPDSNPVYGVTCRLTLLFQGFSFAFASISLRRVPEAFLYCPPCSTFRSPVAGV